MLARGTMPDTGSEPTLAPLASKDARTPCSGEGSKEPLYNIAPPGGDGQLQRQQALEREGVRQWPASRMQASTSCSSSNTSTQYCSMSMLTCPGNQAVRTASMRSDSSIQATSRGPPWMSTTMMEVLVYSGHSLQPPS